MTEEEVYKASAEDTWLVATKISALVRAISSHNGHWWHCARGKGHYTAHKDSLRLATAKDMMELSDD